MAAEGFRFYEAGQVIFKDYVLGDYLGQMDDGWIYTVKNCAGKWRLHVFRSMINWGNQTEGHDGRGIDAVSDREALHLVKIVDFGETVFGESCLVTEHLSETIASVIDAGSLAPKTAGNYFREILKGVMELETFGLVHRDIQPNNVFVCGGTIKFGVSGFVRQPGTHDLARCCRAIDYCAPEVFDGCFTHATDRWAAAVVLFRMLSGRLPFGEEETILSRMKTIALEAPKLDKIPDPFRDFMYKCFAKAPEDRHRKTKSMLAAFESAAAGQTANTASIVAVDTREKSFTNTLGMSFVWVPPGSFLMGTPESDEERGDDEVLHEVVFSRGFYMQTTVVTQEHWHTVWDTEPWAGCGGVCKGDEYPAVCVSWQDAQDFIRKVRQLTGDYYHLPSEAQWEYACRAGTTTRFWFGDNALELERCGWYEGNAESAGEDYPHAVGRKAPSPWGLYDMHGNVWEWCADWFGAYAEGPAAYLTGGPEGGPLTGKERVIRGGSWQTDLLLCRSAHRDCHAPTVTCNDLGFRLALCPNW